MNQKRGGKTWEIKSLASRPVFLLLALYPRLILLTSLSLSFTNCKIERLDYSSGFQTFLTITPNKKHILQWDSKLLQISVHVNGTNASQNISYHYCFDTL